MLKKRLLNCFSHQVLWRFLTEYRMIYIQNVKRHKAQDGPKTQKNFDWKSTHHNINFNYIATNCDFKREHVWVKFRANKEYVTRRQMYWPLPLEFPSPLVDIKSLFLSETFVKDDFVETIQSRNIFYKLTSKCECGVDVTQEVVEWYVQTTYMYILTNVEVFLHNCTCCYKSSYRPWNSSVCSP